MRHLLLFITLVSVAFGVTLPVAAEAEKNDLRAATLYYPPYEFELNGRPSGLAVDILREASKRMGIKDLDIMFSPWKRAVSRVEFGNGDVLFNAGKNEARQVWGLYSKHILILQKYYLFTLKGNNLKTDLAFDNLKQKSIAVRRGYLYGTGPFKKAITSEKKFSDVRLSDSTEHSMRLLINGRVDMFVGDYLPVMHYIVNNGLKDKVELVDHTSSGEDLVVLTWPTYFLFSKKSVDQAFVDRFDTALESMITDQTYDDIYTRYNLRYQLND